MAEEQVPRPPTTFKEIALLAAQNTTPEAEQAAIVALLGGSQSKRAKEYVAMMDLLNARLARK